MFLLPTVIAPSATVTLMSMFCCSGLSATPNKYTRWKNSLISAPSSSVNRTVELGISTPFDVKAKTASITRLLAVYIIPCKFGKPVTVPRLLATLPIMPEVTTVFDTAPEPVNNMIVGK